MRGKLYRAAGIAEKYRITPAGAGKTFVFSSRRQQQQDHPRRCGENCSRHTRHLSRSGSPPQVRGKLHPTEGTLSAFRITPAGAGKTCRYCCLGCRAQDHPRRCGENQSRTPLYIEALGSPPQVRGKRKGFAGLNQASRITPAGAGKTALAAYGRMLSRDHPRRCGENRESLNYATRDIGSPPQVRGKHATTQFSVANLGITPAGAGKTETGKDPTEL